MGLHHKFIDEPLDGDESAANYSHVEGVKIETGILTTSSGEFHQDSGITIENNGDMKVDAGGYKGRVAMDKNFRVGKLKFFSSKTFDSRQHILIDVIEICYNKWGEKYTANYNLWIAVPPNFPVNFNRDHLGKYCLTGFYITSIREKDEQAKYNTHLLLRYFKPLDKDQAEKIAEELHTTKHITNTL